MYVIIKDSFDDLCGAELSNIAVCSVMYHSRHSSVRSLRSRRRSIALDTTEYLFDLRSERVDAFPFQLFECDALLSYQP